MSKLRALADAARRDGVRSLASELAVVDLLPPEEQDAARYLLQLKPQFTPHDFRRAEAALAARRNASTDGKFAAAKNAADRFGLPFDRVYRAAFERKDQEVTEILETSAAYHSKFFRE